MGSFALASLTACVGEEVDTTELDQEVVGPVTWVNVNGATATGNDLVKTAANGWNNAGAQSANSANGDAAVVFTTAEDNAGKILGLSVGNTNDDYKDIDFGLHPSGNGTFYIYEAGKLVQQFGAYDAGDTFRVESVERVVRYFHNGTLVHTSTRVPGRPLLADAALFHTGSTLNDVAFGDFINRNVIGTDETSTSSLRKTVGLADAWGNSGAFSVRGIRADEGFVEFRGGETTHGKAAGLSNTDTNQHFNTIKHGIVLGRHPGGQFAQIFETGTLRFTDTAAWTINDVFRVEVANVNGSFVVQYKKNGNVMFTSALAVTFPLFGDFAFFHDGGTLQNVVVEDTFWTGVVGAENIGSKLVSDVAGAGNAGAVSVRSITGTGFVEFSTGEVKSSKAVGLNAASTSASVNDIDFAIELGASGTVVVRENGVSRGSFGTYTPANVFRVEVALVGGVPTVQYKRDGAVFFTSTGVPAATLFADAALSTVGATIASATLTDLADI